MLVFDVPHYVSNVDSYRNTRNIFGTVRVMTPTRLLVQAPGELRTFALDSRLRDTDVSSVTDSNIVTTDARSDAVVIGKRDGTIALLSTSLHIVGSVPACRVRVESFRGGGSRGGR
jgi:hypothetical protein